MEEKIAGIYVIRIENYFYIGLSSNIKHRKYQHIYKLKNNTHANPKMQNVYNTKHAFMFDVLEVCNVDELEDKEIY